MYQRAACIQPAAGDPAHLGADEPSFLSATVLKNNTVKVETEAEDAALDCSVNSRSSEKHPLDGVFTALQDSSKRKQPSGSGGGDGPPDPVPSVKRRRLIPEVRVCSGSSPLMRCRISLLGRRGQLLMLWAREAFIAALPALA